MCFALHHADKIIANSEHTRDTLLAMDVNPERVAIIYPGVDVSVFRPGLEVTGLRESLGIHSDDNLVFSVGRLSRRKGFDQVIRAVARLRAKGINVHYVLAGIGEDRDYLAGIIREHSIQNRVHMIGAVTDQDLPRWLNTCDVFAMPNREIDGDNEGFGMVFIEAAACGKPVLAGDAGGTGSAVLDGVTGLRADGESLESVTDCLHSLLTNTVKSGEMGRLGLTRVKSEFSWESVSNKTLDLSREMTRSDNS